MSSLLFCIPDFILVPIYAYILIRLCWSAYNHYRFFRFFISTGICGITSVVANILVSQINYPVPLFPLFAVFVLANQAGAIGATIGKFFIAYDRFEILRGRWSTVPISIILAFQYISPLIVSTPILFFGFSKEQIGKNYFILTLVDTGNNVQRVVNTIVYSSYIVFTLLITAASLSIMSRFSDNFQQSRARCSKQRELMFVTGICILSHLFKATHQVVWFVLTMTGQMTPWIFAIHIQPSYLIVNGLATYITPIALLVCSKKIRRLVFGRFAFPKPSISSIVITI